MPIVLIRHGQSKFNSGETDSNTYDCELSQQGIIQSRSLQGSYDLVITSVMKQTLHVSDRVTDFLNLLKRYSEIYDNICVITHGVFMNKLLSRLAEDNSEYKRYKLYFNFS